MINFILCGGPGARLWPLSRTLLPKQFVKLFNDRSLFQATVLRKENAIYGGEISAHHYFRDFA